MLNTLCTTLPAQSSELGILLPTSLSKGEVYQKQSKSPASCPLASDGQQQVAFQQELSFGLSWIMLLMNLSCENLPF